MKVISKDVESLEGMSYLPVSVSFSPFEKNNQQHLVSKSCQENDRILQRDLHFSSIQEKNESYFLLNGLEGPYLPQHQSPRAN
jgi:hypothetical protein